MPADLKYRTILLKVSGEALMGKGTDTFAPDVLAYLAGEITLARNEGVRFGVVSGGGNIFRGLAGTAWGVDRVVGDYMGMLATLINCLALQEALRAQGCPSRVLSPFGVPQISEPVSGPAARRILAEGQVVLFAGGTGNPFFTTDSGAALRALEAGCDLVLKATRVDGVYDKDPARHADARFLPRVTYDEALRLGLGIMDMTAFALCREHKMPICILNIARPGAILAAARGEAAGSWVTG